MPGNIWRLSCCQKRKDRGQELSRSKQKDLGASRQADGSVENVNEPCENGRQCERSERPERPSQDRRDGAPAEQKRATGQGDDVHDPNSRNEGVKLNGLELKALLHLVGKVDGSVVPPPGEDEEEEKAYRLIRVQLETVQKEKFELEAQVVQAQRSVRDLRHEIAVLQKRLQVAENRVPNLPAPCPPPAPPPPPPAQPLVNPLRALLTIIQKSRTSRDPNVCPGKDVGPMPESPVDTDAPHDHQCPGMNQVLEMIRGGVSLRHVIQVHKGTVRVEGDEPVVDGQLVPELHRILRRRKVSADKHVSDGSCDCSTEEDCVKDPASHAAGAPTSRSSPRESPLHDPHAGEDPPQDARDTAGEQDDGPSDGDAVSTASTIPLTAPLDQGRADWAGVPPCPEGAAPSPPSEGPSGGAGGQPPTEGRASPTDLGSGLEVVPADRPSTAQPSSSPDPTVRYLNWERWSDVDLRAALPLKSIFKSVSLMAGGGVGGVEEEEDDAQQNQPPRRRESESPTTSEPDRGWQSFGSADFGESFPDLPEDERAEFAALHRALKPSPGSSEECQGQGVLRPDFEESAEGPEMGGLLPETPRAPGGPALVRSGTGGQDPPEEEERLDRDGRYSPAASFISAVEEYPDYHQMVFHC